MTAKRMLFVRYPDETVRFGCYHTPTDIAHETLWPTPTLWNKERLAIAYDEEDADFYETVHQVDVWSTSGFGWTGEATVLRLITRHPYGVVGGEHHSVTRWWDIEPAAHIFHEKPQWVKDVEQQLETRL